MSETNPTKRSLRGCCIYWVQHFKESHERRESAVALITAVIGLVFLGLKHFGIVSKDDDIAWLFQLVGSLFFGWSVLYMIFWLPYKRHHEAANTHQEEIDALKQKLKNRLSTKGIGTAIQNGQNGCWVELENIGSETLDLVRLEITQISGEYCNLSPLTHPIRLLHEGFKIEPAFRSNLRINSVLNRILGKRIFEDQTLNPSGKKRFLLFQPQYDPNFMEQLPGTVFKQRYPISIILSPEHAPSEKVYVGVDFEKEYPIQILATGKNTESRENFLMSFSTRNGSLLFTLKKVHL